MVHQNDGVSVEAPQEERLVGGDCGGDAPQAAVTYEHAGKAEGPGEERRASYYPPVLLTLELEDCIKGGLVCERARKWLCLK